MKKGIYVAIICFLITASLILYSRFISTSGIKTNEYKIKINNLDNNFNGLKIVHFSDIHYGRIINNKRLQLIVDEINNNKPDIVVFTGDLFDKDIKLNLEESENIANILKNINSTIGKYIIKGENDNSEFWDTIIQAADFINLDNTYSLIFNKNNIPIIISSNNEKSVNEFNTYKANNNVNYSILLTHKPDDIKNIDSNNYNLILAGHTHLGQIRLPFIGGVLYPDSKTKYRNDYYKVNNADLYISNGLGTSRINYRFMNRPSINLYRLVNE